MSRLSAVQIEDTCRALLARQRRVTVRQVMAALRTAYGISGRTERIARLLRAVERTVPRASTQSAAVEALREQLQRAEQRAARAEAREQAHQDYWAARYAEKIAALERRQRVVSSAGPAITHEQYLNLHRRIAELSRRLARYEDVEDRDGRD